MKAWTMFKDVEISRIETQVVTNLELTQTERVKLRALISRISLGKSVQISREEAEFASELNVLIFNLK